MKGGASELKSAHHSGPNYPVSVSYFISRWSKINATTTAVHYLELNRIVLYVMLSSLIRYISN
jgi:hypothetical protein